MTILTTTNKARFVGDAATTTWPFTFLIPTASDLYLYYTDLVGTTTLISASLYSVTGIGSDAGGTVTYPLSGSPIAAGTILEILRTVPYKQETDLINQDGFYPQVVEDALDNIVMQMQQLVEVQGRNLTVGTTDTSPGTLPSATERALQVLGFDASGNAIATQPSDSPVSTAMQPVVAAASLAAARTAFGLGNAAVETIGLGLQDNGSGSLQTYYAITQDSTNLSVTSAFHATQRMATGALNYTLPRANTLFNGFGFWVSALTASVSFLINAADSFAGMSSGTTFTMPAGTRAFISTDAAASGTWSASNVQLIANSGATNFQLSASVAASALTISIKDRNGNDPSTTSPVLIPFRSATVGSGTPVYRVLTSSLSLVVPSTALMGFASGEASRLWIMFLDNAGVVELAAVNARNTENIYPLKGWGIVTTTAMTVASDSAAVPYSTSARTSVAYVTAGYMTWETGLTATGTWDAVPTRIQLAGLGVPLPGDVIQTQRTNTAAATLCAGVTPNDDTIPQVGEGTQILSIAAFVPTSAANLIEFDNMNYFYSAGSVFAIAALFQNGAANAIAATSGYIATTEQDSLRLAHVILAAVTTSLAFTIRLGSSSANNITINALGNSSRVLGGVEKTWLTVKEIMA